MDRGLKTLLATYWDRGAWVRNIPASEDYEQAKAEGYMFDSVPVRTHDKTLRELQCVLERITPGDVANAFLYSLSTRQLQYRSALGSYYYALAIPAHSHTEAGPCRFCNWSPLRRADPPETGLSEYNVFNFERFKWGGVRHTEPEYALFDLEQFLRLPKVTPTEEDQAILMSVLHAVKELPPDKKAGAYRELITKKKLLKSNKNEVAVMLDILGICGVLSGAEAPCYCDCFVDEWHRAPQEHVNDFTYPVNRWHVSDGINTVRFKIVFGLEYSG